MPGPPASARRMACSHSEKLPAGNGAGSVADNSVAGIVGLWDFRGWRAHRASAVEPGQRLRLGSEGLTTGTAIARHDPTDVARVQVFARHHDGDSQPVTGNGYPLPDEFVTLE